LNPIERVIEKLNQEQIFPVIEEKGFEIIKWPSKRFNDQISFNETNIAYQEDRLAWFESHHWSHHLLRIFEQDTYFDWIPKTYNPVFGCYCLLIEWYKDHLLFIYQEKHCIYICSLIQQSVKSFYFGGENIGRKGNLIAYEEYGRKDFEDVKLIQIPELIHLKPIFRQEAKRLGLIPQGLNRPDDFLKEK
jgi:hypothetical protein